MSLTVKQIDHQINANYNEMDQIVRQFHTNPPAWKSVQLTNRFKMIWASQEVLAKQHFKITGKSMVLMNPTMPELMITGNLEEEMQQEQAAKLQAVRKKQMEDALYALKQDYQRICLALQSQYDISVEWQHAMFSHWTRLGAGMHAKHPLFTIKQIEEKAWPLILAAEKLYAAGRYVKAYEKAGEAARIIKWGFDFLNSWMSKLETGAARAIVGIKVSAALATLIVTGPAQLGVLGTMAVAGTGEAAQQGTTLIAQGVDPGMSVSLDDVKDAALAVAVNAGTAGLGKGLGNLVAKGIGGKAAQAVIDNTPPGETVTQTMRMKIAEIIGQRIEQYVSANAQSIANKMLKLDKSPDWNWWYMIVTPAINGATMEMAKEPELQALFKK